MSSTFPYQNASGLEGLSLGICMRKTAFSIDWNCSLCFTGKGPRLWVWIVKITEYIMYTQKRWENFLPSCEPSRLSRRANIKCHARIVWGLSMSNYHLVIMPLLWRIRVKGTRSIWCTSHSTWPIDQFRKMPPVLLGSCNYLFIMSEVCLLIVYIFFLIQFNTQCFFVRYIVLLGD